MRAALKTGLINQATQQGVQAGRLRRRLVFQRIVRRLSDDDRWVLKGGYLLEARLVSPIPGMDLRTARVLAVDVAQHAAEKFHAICRTYAGDRPGTRVKDLVDVVLLAEAGLLPHPRLGERLRIVFAGRDAGDPPTELPGPPTSWTRDYEVLIAGLDVAASSAEAGMSLAAAVYRQPSPDRFITCSSDPGEGSTCPQRSPPPA